MIGLLLIVALAVTTPLARATHLPDHRFIVLGYVTNAKGRAMPGVPVVATRLKTGLEYPTKTEADGFYFLVLHLHDEDLGEALKVLAGKASTQIRARFDVDDKKTERGTRLDFRGGKPAEKRPAFAQSLRAYLAR